MEVIEHRGYDDQGGMGDGYGWYDGGGRGDGIMTGTGSGESDGVYFEAPKFIQDLKYSGTSNGYGYPSAKSYEDMFLKRF